MKNRLFLEKIKERFSKINKKQWAILFLIFLLGFGIRFHMTKYELPFEFDSYWHARMLSYLVQNGSVPFADPMAYYQASGTPGGIGVDLSAPLFWNISAVVYHILNGFGPYSKQAIIQTMFIVPALFGALAAVATFFLVREVLDSKAGYVSAIMAAVIPAFVYRTMGGFFEPTSMGYFWIILGMVFLVRSVKRIENIKIALINAAISGVLFGLLALSWKGYSYVPLILVPYFAFALWGAWMKEKSLESVKRLLACFAVSFALFIGIASITSGWDWILPLFLDVPLSYIQRVFPTATLPVLLGVMAAIGILIGAIVYFFRPQESDSFWKALSIARVGVLLLLVAAVIGIIFLNVDLSNRSGTLGGSVGEENLGNQFFGNKYNALWILSIVALALIPWKESKKAKDNASVLLFFLILVTFMMAYIKLKFTFLHGLPLAISIGVVFYYAFEAIQSMHSFEKKSISVALAFMLLIGIAAGSYFITQQSPNVEENTGWKETLNWLKDNTPKDAKIFNWWDEGHWISFLGERAVLIDNRNVDLEADSAVAQFLLTDDLNKAIEIVDSFGSTHLVLGDDLLAKQGSLGIYAYYIRSEVNYNDPRLQGYFGYLTSCEKNEAPVTKEITYNCGTNTLSQTQMDALPSQWTSKPNQLLPDNRTAIFVYKSKESNRLYAFNAKANNTILAKMWFNEPTVAQYFPESHSIIGVKVFETNFGH